MLIACFTPLYQVSVAADHDCNAFFRSEFFYRDRLPLSCSRFLIYWHFGIDISTNVRCRSLVSQEHWTMLAWISTQITVKYRDIEGVSFSEGVV